MQKLYAIRHHEGDYLGAVARLATAASLRLGTISMAIVDCVVFADTDSVVYTYCSHVVDITS